jgi:hypothetical protein
VWKIPCNDVMIEMFGSKRWRCCRTGRRDCCYYEKGTVAILGGAMIVMLMIVGVMLMNLVRMIAPFLMIGVLALRGWHCRRENDDIHQFHY